MSINRRLLLLVFSLPVSYVYFQFLLTSWGFTFPFYTIFYSLILFFTGFWLFSIFIFLYKRGQYSIFVSSLQRFWKRTLYLFWLIELFLFFIYIFLMVNSPNETYYLLDHPSLFNSHDLVDTPWLRGVRIFIFLCVITSVMILLPGFRLLSLALLSLLFSIVGYMVDSEFAQVFYLFNALQGVYYAVNLEHEVYDEHMYLHSKHSKYKRKKEVDYSKLSAAARKIEQDKWDENMWVMNGYSLVWEEDEDKLRFRTINFFYILMGFLKLWHVVFIAVVFFSSIKVLIPSVKFSVNVLSLNLQNFFFLFGFTFLTMLLTYKYYMQFAFFTPYFYFFLNYNTWLLSLKFANTLFIL